MGRGKGSKKSARHQPQPETPVRDRLRHIVASRNASSESVGTTQLTPSPSTSATSIAHTSSSWLTDGHSGSDLSTNTAPVPNSPAPLSKKARRRAKTLETTNTDSRQSAPVDDTISSTVDNGDALQPYATSQTTSFQRIHDKWHSFFPPIKDLHDRIYSTQPLEAAEKRDSVFSTNWEDVKVGHSGQTPTKQSSNLAAWRRRFHFYTRWPCRMYRWLRVLVATIIQGFRGTRRNDFILTFSLLFVCLFIAYTTLDFILTGLVKGVNAQNSVEEANCSIVMA
ncbi:hypothetical protein OPT61_g5621 [Boeremia exigua]|uniref:Uncharacterized protein n=1 Tax=Boeremia exigua TaxID=749465 RepID=A0ACC2I9L0_9PLEO|nr:hypothetical protein OPT61_g5621 [Boeremia exigua]